MNVSLDYSDWKDIVDALDNKLHDIAQKSKSMGGKFDGLMALQSVYKNIDRIKHNIVNDTHMYPFKEGQKVKVTDGYDESPGIVVKDNGNKITVSVGTLLWNSMEVDRNNVFIQK